MYHNLAHLMSKFAEAETETEHHGNVLTSVSSPPARNGLGPHESERENERERELSEAKAESVSQSSETEIELPLRVKDQSDTDTEVADSNDKSAASLPSEMRAGAALSLHDEYTVVQLPVNVSSSAAQTHTWNSIDTEMDTGMDADMLRNSRNSIAHQYPVINVNEMCTDVDVDMDVDVDVDVDMVDLFGEDPKAEEQEDEGEGEGEDRASTSTSTSPTSLALNMGSNLGLERELEMEENPTPTPLSPVPSLRYPSQSPTPMPPLELQSQLPSPMPSLQYPSQPPSPPSYSSLFSALEHPVNPEPTTSSTESFSDGPDPDVESDTSDELDCVNVDSQLADADKDSDSELLVSGPLSATTATGSLPKKIQPSSSFYPFRPIHNHNAAAKRPFTSTTDGYDPQNRRAIPIPGPSASTALIRSSAPVSNDPKTRHFIMTTKELERREKKWRRKGRAVENLQLASQSLMDPSGTAGTSQKHRISLLDDHPDQPSMSTKRRKSNDKANCDISTIKYPEYWMTKPTLPIDKITVTHWKNELTRLEFLGDIGNHDAKDAHRLATLLGTIDRFKGRVPQVLITQTKLGSSVKDFSHDTCYCEYQLSIEEMAGRIVQFWKWKYPEI
ncbi:hypothetical protein D9758_001314 [Tetrapyrgos nigripes]|uniref:Uncharacterized protein n=1 Tax=Tetrapyrgos nigripes TaxID=182062 RepID=A0A8H5GRA2_9AGAR|nr:hypothetical protein D9758_001314 [Tetrapyrgos nigripes]